MWGVSLALPHSAILNSTDQNSGEGALAEDQSTSFTYKRSHCQSLVSLVNIADVGKEIPG